MTFVLLPPVLAEGKEIKRFRSAAARFRGPLAMGDVILLSSSEGASDAAYVLPKIHCD